MKALITTSTFAEYSQTPLEILREAGCVIVQNPTGKKVTTGYLMQELQDTDLLIAGTEELSRDILSKAPQLKVISRVGTGMDSVDLEAAKQLGIRVRNTPDGPTDAVAELTLGLMLDCCRHISKSDRDIRQGVWQKQMGQLLKGKTIGLVGYGHIGRRVAALVTAFGAEVIAYDPYVKEAISVSFEACLRRSDLLSIHVPLTSDTEGLIGYKEFSQMKSSAYLLNVSRGGIVNEKDLEIALKNGQLSGAAIDTFEVEPYEGPLRNIDNVVLTSHIGSYAKESRIYMETQAVNYALEAV